MVVDDWKHLESEGIQMPGQCEHTVYPVVLGNKGDWSYLVPWWSWFQLFFFHGRFVLVIFGVIVKPRGSVFEKAVVARLLDPV